MSHQRAVVLLALLVLTATVVEGVGRAEFYALKHDPHGAGTVALWTLLLAPLVGGLGGAFAVAAGRRHDGGRMVGAACLGAAVAVVLGVVTVYLLQINVSCVNAFNSDECGIGSVAAYVGGAVLVVLLLLVGLPLFTFSSSVHRRRDDSHV